MPLHIDLGKQLELVANIPTIPAILNLLRDQTGMRFVGLARVTRERWIVCAVLDEGGFGLVPGDELDVDTTICKAQLDKPETIAFDDALVDARYRDHVAPRMYGFRSHMSAAIHLADGSYFGSLCVLDPDPVAVNNERTVGMLESMAALIGRLLDEAFTHGATVQALLHEKAIGVSREQFLAVVAHDIRNPLATMFTASEILVRSPDAAIARVGARLRISANRMTGLLDDLVDFARGRAGSEMPVRLALHGDVDSTLEDVVQEARAIAPGRDIRASVDIDRPVRCDPARLQQVLSNLIGNAVTYGAPDRPIMVEAYERDGTATMVVTNWGQPIEADRLERVFLPYSRYSDVGEDTSMGLGLHICQLIARAHGGTLTVSSDPASGTRFEMSWPSDCVA